MSFIIKEEGGSRIPPVAEGSYPAVCVGLVDLGLQEQEFEGRKKVSRQVTIIWELVGETIETSEGTLPRTINKTYTASLHERSGLRKDLKSWRGREFTAEELKGFDLQNILGAPCLLQIVHKNTANGTYANIAAIMSLPKGMPRPVPTTVPTLFDIDADNAESEFANLPEWLQKKVVDSPTWAERTAGKTANFVEMLNNDDDGELPF